MKKQFGTNQGYIAYCDDDFLRVTIPKKFAGGQFAEIEIPVSQIKLCKIETMSPNSYLLTFVDKENSIWQQMKTEERSYDIAEKIRDFINKDTPQQDLQQTFYKDFARTMPEKNSTLSLVALILGTLAAILLVYSWLAPIEGNEFTQLGVSIGRAIVMPSAICTLIAVILMPLWGFVGIPSMILQFIAFAKMKPAV